jgi:hypothetical protein
MVKQGIMVNQATVQLEQVQKLEKTNQLDSSNVPNQIITSVGEDLFDKHFDAQQVILSSSIRLNFDNLKSYERVDTQFKRYGIIFNNSLGIQPSNPAFPRHSELNLLIGSPQNGLLEELFSYVLLTGLVP